MKNLGDFKQAIHKCSKCGLCQQKCPVYHVTGNDCTVSRGHFQMLEGVLKRELKLSKTINNYLDLCLKCGLCSKCCPSGINVVDIITAAKSEYFNKHLFEKLIAFVKKYLIFGLLLNCVGLFCKKTKSKQFEKKVIYFGGCGSKVRGNKDIVTILNSLNIEVLSPNFECCGIYMLSCGDLRGFNTYINNFINTIKKTDINEIVVNCASCEQVIKSYYKWSDNKENIAFLQNLKIKNVFEYIKENNLYCELQNKAVVTYHKPCHLENFTDIEWVLNNTKNLEYVEMDNYDSCCGFNGIFNFNQMKIIFKILKNKRNNILKSNAKIALTSCLGCETALNLSSLGAYKTADLLHFLAENIKVTSKN